MDTVYCIPEIAGFHHSWLGDENYISEKIAAYTHNEHAVYNNIDYIKECLAKGISIFPDQELEVNNDIKLLSYIEDHKEKYKKYFVV